MRGVHIDTNSKIVRDTNIKMELVSNKSIKKYLIETDILLSYA